MRILQREKRHKSHVSHAHVCTRITYVWDESPKPNLLHLTLTMLVLVLMLIEVRLTDNDILSESATSRFYLHLWRLEYLVVTVLQEVSALLQLSFTSSISLVHKPIPSSWALSSREWSSKEQFQEFDIISRNYDPTLFSLFHQYM